MDRGEPAAEAGLCSAVSTCGEAAVAKKEGAHGGTLGSPVPSGEGGI